jgi:hypothetical protein
MSNTDADRIRLLNDELRKHLLGGGAVITPGIAALGSKAVEHDFGAFDFDGTPVMFKIDYYDKDLQFHSPNPADSNVTERVLTIMLAAEY